ncbi:MAG: cytochrome ubiquinol oxidase subunit I [Pseudohongiellaceae bacterium]
MPDISSALILARLQFAFTIAFHIIFPALSIGLASYLAVLEALWLRTGREIYLVLYKYWLKIFAVTFGMGVVSGVVMSYQFGTNWSEFSDRAGPVIGPLMGYEVLTAFFLESGFLGVMIFGMNRVSRGIHFTATCLVAAGTLFSAFWILSVNSWMHTPSGFGFNEAGQFIPENWLQVIFNPSFPYRLVHMVLAAFLSTSFVVGGAAAFQLLRNNRSKMARQMFSMSMWMALFVTPVQIIAGDLHGLNTLEHQPAKVAAMEGHFETLRGAPLILFGWPDEEAEITRYTVSIPKLGSLILTHSLDGEIPGLTNWPREDRPPVAIVFTSFRVMVGIGLLMLLTGLAGALLRWRGTLYQARWFHRWACIMGPTGLIALLAGWITTEVGRQPYTVYGLMRTSESLSPVAAPAIGSSLAGFVTVYCIVYGAGVYYLVRLMGKSPPKSEQFQAEAVLAPRLRASSVQGWDEGDSSD